MLFPVYMGVVVFVGVILVTLFFILGTKEQTTEPYSWKQADRVEVLMDLYFAMVLKHGPDSVEAKAFRYGIDCRDDLLIKDEEALRAFSIAAKCMDNAWRQNRKTNAVCPSC